MSPFCDKTRFCNLIFELHSGVLKEKDVKKKKKKKKILSPEDPRYLPSDRRLCASLAADLGQLFFFFFLVSVFLGGLMVPREQETKTQ